MAFIVYAECLVVPQLPFRIPLLSSSCQALIASASVDCCAAVSMLYDTPAQSRSWTLLLAHPFCRCLPWAHSKLTQLLGLCLMQAFVLLLWATHHALGAAFMPVVCIKPQQQLITHSVFGYVRHPMYLAVTLGAAGISLFAGCYAFLIGAAVLVIALLRARLELEERVLAVHFGAAYVSYCHRTPRLFPPLARWPSLLLTLVADVVNAMRGGGAQLKHATSGTSELRAVGGADASGWIVDMAATRVIVVMGVMGSGKTTIGRMLAQRLSSSTGVHYRFMDADDFHPAGIMC